MFTVFEKGDQEDIEEENGENIENVEGEFEEDLNLFDNVLKKILPGNYLKLHKNNKTNSRLL